MKNCGQIPWNVQDLLADGKTLYERRFGEPFDGPVIPFDSMVVKAPLIWYEFFSLNIPRTPRMQTLEQLGHFGRVRNPYSKAQCKRSDNAEKS